MLTFYSVLKTQNLKRIKSFSLLPIPKFSVPTYNLTRPTKNVKRITYNFQLLTYNSVLFTLFQIIAWFPNILENPFTSSPDQALFISPYLPNSELIISNGEEIPTM